MLLVTKLLEKLQVLNNNIGMSNVCSVPLSYIFMRGQGVKIFSLVSKKCRDLGFLIPRLYVKNKPSQDEKFKKLKSTGKNDSDTEDDEENVGYEGATVFPPKKGVYYEPIPVLDYASLYPRSIYILIFLMNVFLMILNMIIYLVILMKQLIIKIMMIQLQLVDLQKKMMELKVFYH